MSPQQHAALQQSLSTHVTATPAPGAPALVPPGLAWPSLAWPQAFSSPDLTHHAQHQQYWVGHQQGHQQQQHQQQQQHAATSLGHPKTAQQAAATAAAAAAGGGTVSEGPSVDAAAPGRFMHEPAHTWHAHTDPNHSAAVLQVVSSNAAPGQTARYPATAGVPASAHLQVLEGRPVPVVAAANGQLAVLSPRLDDAFPVADPAALAQNQAQLYYVIRSEEAGNQRHDLQALAADAGLYGEGASALVEQTLQRTVGARDAAACSMLDDANNADTEELLSALFSEPQEVALQQVLYTDAFANHHQQLASAGVW